MSEEKVAAPSGAVEEKEIAPEGAMYVIKQYMDVLPVVFQLASPSGFVYKVVWGYHHPHGGYGVVDNCATIERNYRQYVILPCSTWQILEKRGDQLNQIPAKGIWQIKEEKPYVSIQYQHVNDINATSFEQIYTPIKDLDQLILSKIPDGRYLMLSNVVGDSRILKLYRIGVEAWKRPTIMLSLVNKVGNLEVYKAPPIHDWGKDAIDPNWWVEDNEFSELQIGEYTLKPTKYMPSIYYKHDVYLIFTNHEMKIEQNGNTVATLPPGYYIIALLPS